MDDPQPIGEILDEARAEILGATGNWNCAELVRQTTENRQRIEREVRLRFQAVFAEVYADLTGFQMDPRTLETAARIEAHRRIQAEVARRVSEEEQAFRDRITRLHAWPKERKHPRCDGCESPPADGSG
jgi:hypothetical protein